MIKFLGKLEDEEKFWPWMRRIAMNKVHRQYRQAQKRRDRIKSAAREGYYGDYKDREDGFANLVSDELRQIVTTTMRELKTRHREVLVLRCYEELGYSEIAQEMGCSEFGARMLFLRAKKALAGRLAKRGLGKGSMVLALTAFGKMTAPSKAAAAEMTVTAASLDAGVAATVASVAASKTGVVSVAAAGLIAAGTMVAVPGGETAGFGPGGDISKLSPAAITKAYESSANDEECWYFYPEGREGAVMMRKMTHDWGSGRTYCEWLQNEQGNYYYDRRKSTIYMNNYRTWKDDLSIWQLPTDKSNFRNFILQVEGTTEPMEYIHHDVSGLLVISKRGGEEGNKSHVFRHHKVMDEEYFRYGWPGGLRMVDNRDMMHKRGWTFFRVSGHINGYKVTGKGRIPFVYGTYKEHYPWLSLRVSQGLKVVDNGEEACVYGFSGAVIARYNTENLFKGLGRPWVGLHTMDIVRRDAAEQGAWYETELFDKDRKAKVTVSRGGGRLVYTINLKRDVIEKIELLTAGGTDGELVFDYLDDLTESTGGFAEPSGSKGYRRAKQKGPGMQWLLQLAEGTLGG
jgi:RNA polymerase sigma factor (sigma-70 family)